MKIGLCGGPSGRMNKTHIQNFSLYRTACNIQELFMVVIIKLFIGIRAIYFKLLVRAEMGIQKSVMGHNETC